MAYIGQPPLQEFTSPPTKDTFTGNGSLTYFDLAQEVVSGGEYALEVFIDNVRQEPGTGKSFTLGNDGSDANKRITFTAAPADGAVIYVLNDKTNLTAIAPTATDLNGVELILDADADTSITADSDDTIDIKIAGADDFQFTANTFTALSGSTIKANTIAETTAASGVTIDGVLLKDSVLGANTVDSDAYVDGSIDNAHLAANSVDSDNYVDGSIDNAHLAANSVDSDNYVDGSIDNAHLAANSVDSDNYVDGSIDNAHLAANSVDSDNYVDGSIDNAHLADDAVDSDEIAAGAIDDAHFSATTIVGKQTIYVPANAMNPTASNGCSNITQVETTSGRPDMQVLDFDKDSDEFAQFTVAFPKSWNLGTVTYQVFWSGIASADDVDWMVDAVAMNDNETIDVAYGTAVVVTDNSQGAVEELLVSAESSAVTIAGTPADNDLTYFRIGRDVSGDAMAGDARLHGVKIFFTTDALNDA
jgi:hypothetical protein